MAVDQARLLALVGRGGVLPWWIRPVLARATGLAQVLTAPGAITALLDAPSVTVPYGPRSEVLGLGAFPLALDGDAHRAARASIVDALAASDAAHTRGLGAAARLARQRVDDADGRLEVVGDVIEPALCAWVERWFGLPGRGTDLLRAGRLVLHATFLNPTVPAGKVNAEGLRRAVDGIGRRRAALATAVPLAPKGSLAAALSASTGDVGRTVDHLLALTVGPLALGTWVLAEVVDELLETSWVLDSIDDDESARAAFTSALARRPPLPGVLRQVPAPMSVPTGKGTRRVPAGQVLAATACVRHLPGQPAPGASADLAFGSGVHACLGRSQVTEVAGLVLGALGSRSPRRAAGAAGRLVAGPAPSGVAHWPFPGRLEVALLR